MHLSKGTKQKEGELVESQVMLVGFMNILKHLVKQNKYKLNDKLKTLIMSLLKNNYQRSNVLKTKFYATFERLLEHQLPQKFIIPVSNRELPILSFV